MPEPIIQVQNLGKKYTLHHEAGGQQGLRHVLQHMVTAPFRALRQPARKAPATREEFWALRDISFEVEPGEVVGIIGRNGAGKSTLLKILSRITEPTVGRVTIEGRVASLLEVGTGFHAELTGRENIFLNGAILGMSRGEIKRKFDEIVAFAEVEKFLGTPVKFYSSGMYVRLAFAVAAHLEPEILIVDEVLAVGDAPFQRKCLGKMQDVSRKEGRTVLFVSHNLTAVQSLCGKAIYLKSGCFAGMGPTAELVDLYLREAQENEGASRQLGPGLVLNGLKFNPSTVLSGQSSSFALSITGTTSTPLMELALVMYSSLGVRVAVIDLRPHGTTNLNLIFSELVIEGTISSLPLVEGSYHLGLYVRTETMAEDFMELTVLHVLPAINQRHSPYPPAYRGALELETDFKIDSKPPGNDRPRP